MQLFQLSKIFPNLESAQQVLASVANGTINIMSVFIAYLVAQLLAKHFDADATLVGLTSVAAFMILYPTSFSVDGVNAISTQYLGAQGLFVAMIVACLVGEFLPKLFKVKRLQIKMPDMVPPAVSPFVFWNDSYRDHRSSYRIDQFPSTDDCARGHQ